MVLLLDEPDAHLHPKAVSQVIETIKELARIGIQCIVTTHNPITVSLIDNDNLFLMVEDEKCSNVSSGKKFGLL